MTLATRNRAADAIAQSKELAIFSGTQCSWLLKLKLSFPSWMFLDIVHFTWILHNSVYLKLWYESELVWCWCVAYYISTELGMNAVDDWPMKAKRKRSKCPTVSHVTFVCWNVCFSYDDFWMRFYFIFYPFSCNSTTYSFFVKFFFFLVVFFFVN